MAESLQKYQEMFAAAQKAWAQHFDFKKDTIIQIGSATCEGAAGSELAENEFRKCIAL